MKSFKLNNIISEARVVCVMLTAFGISTLQAQDNAGLMLGNCRSKVVAYETGARDDRSGSALYYPEDVMKAYAGCTVDEIAFAMQTAGKGTVRVFLANSLKGEPLFETTLTEWSGNWNTVRLDRPYVIDGKALYIGYEADSARFLAYTDRFVTNEEWIRKGAGGWMVYQGEKSAALYATVGGGALPRHNVRLTTAVMPGYATTGARVPYSGEFANLGVEKVSELTFDYYVGGEKVGSETCGGLAVEPRTNGGFDLEGPVLDTEGDYQMQIVVSAVNGVPDPVASDNASALKTTVCRESFTPRKVLLEVFSTEKCSNCPGAHAAIGEQLEGNGAVVEICHHAGYYTDKFTVEESIDYEWFYAYLKYAPAMMIDRTCNAESYPNQYDDGVPLISATGALAKYFVEEAAKVPAFVALEVDSRFDAAARTLDVTVKGRPLLDCGSSTPTGLIVWLKEDNIYSETQVGSAGGFNQRHVTRKCLTPAWGDAVDAGACFEKTYSCTIPAEWDEKEMSVVAFVAKYNPDDKNDCEVLNTEQVAMAAPSAGIAAAASAGAARFPADVYTLTGQKLLDNAGAEDVARLGKGVYLVKGRKYIVR